MHPVEPFHPTNPRGTVLVRIALPHSQNKFVGLAIAIVRQSPLIDNVLAVRGTDLSATKISAEFGTRSGTSCSRFRTKAWAQKSRGQFPQSRTYQPLRTANRRVRRDRDRPLALDIDFPIGRELRIHHLLDQRRHLNRVGQECGFVFRIATSGEQNQGREKAGERASSSPSIALVFGLELIGQCHLPIRIGQVSPFSRTRHPWRKLAKKALPGVAKPCHTPFVLSLSKHRSFFESVVEVKYGPSTGSGRAEFDDWS